MHFILDVLDDVAALHRKDAKQIVKKDQRRPSLSFFTVSSPSHSITKQRPCRICFKKFGIRKDTIYHCPGCLGDPALCCNSHYMDYHGQSKNGLVAKGLKLWIDDQTRCQVALTILTEFW
ncbi:hypothetical protein E2C01_047320 [Portunus trituberculatus]|uniref:PiggyBac transposable element-derived protein 4 C-terminal zinc-ribbon domain-containing protein n=1 Tax=Portunus trituberculatus TaxID=210409 RepID=A0A5B7G051_PORTR|nr:hypothetical protein [Portunus trituberculatus]